MAECSGYLSERFDLNLQSGKDVVLGNNGDEDAKLIAVLNGSREERPDVFLRFNHITVNARDYYDIRTISK